MIPIQTRVRVRSDKTARGFTVGSTGVVVPQMAFMPDGPGEVTVLFDGDTATASEVPETDLEILGPENPVPDLARCGMGRGVECCIFLGLRGATPLCLRTNELRWDIIFRRQEMGAKREPADPYPACMVFPPKEGR